jgi:hypothetical protein
MSKATESAQFDSGGVLSQFANIERMIQEYLAYRIYSSSKDKGDKIYVEILSHKFFSFDFKKVLLFSCLKEQAPSIYAQFPKTALNKAQELRNIVAHGGLTVRDTNLFNNYDALEITHGGKEYNFSNTIADFRKNADKVMAALFEIEGMNKKYVTEHEPNVMKEVGNGDGKAESRSRKKN